jgi:circadian clock protein KaiC
MAEESEFAPPPPRVPSGIPGFDEVLGGGFFKAGIYLILGPPGAGKTILANQICAHHVRSGGRALYVTLLAEAHGRMLGQLQTLSFFDRKAVGSSLKYVNGFTSVEQDGLRGLLELLRGAVREQRADLLVMDGMATAGGFARSPIDYKKFLGELQSWVGVVGCTVLLLTSTGLRVPGEAEHTMVDGIVELRNVVRGEVRALRQIHVVKLRGSGFVEGGHPYLISGDGVRVFPRFEAHEKPGPSEQANAGLASTGVAELDELLGGGLRRSSTTLLLGSSGSGKTIFGLHFLAAGAQRGEPALYLGFYENPSDLRLKADRLGLLFSELCESGKIELLWRSPAEGILDVLAADLLEAVRRRGVRVLFIDGLAGFKEAAYSERLSGFFAVMSQVLAGLGVTTLITEETRQLFVREIEVPTPGVSAIFQNIVFLRSVDTGAELLRLISVMKTRDSAHSRALRRFEITDRGIRIGKAFLPADTAMRGAAVASAKPRAARRRRKR